VTVLTLSDTLTSSSYIPTVLKVTVVVLLAFVPRVDVETLGLAKDAVIEALARARTLPGIPLADALVVATARAAGAEAFVSFDRGSGRHGLRVIEP
jgi:predicted nucleic acid-binding protein